MSQQVFQPGGRLAFRELVCDDLFSLISERKNQMIWEILDKLSQEGIYTSRFFVRGVIYQLIDAPRQMASQAPVFLPIHLFEQGNALHTFSTQSDRDWEKVRVYLDAILTATKQPCELYDALPSFLHKYLRDENINRSTEPVQYCQETMAKIHQQHRPAHEFMQDLLTQKLLSG